MKRTYRIKTNILLFLCLSLTAIAQHFRKIELPTQSQLPVANIHCMMQDADGYLWYGTEQGGLCRDNGYQIDVFRPSDVCGHIKANNITCLSETSGGDVLIGTEDGLFVLDKHTYHLSSTKVNGTRIEALLTDTKGCTWVGVNGFILQLGKNLEIGKKHPCQKGDNQLDVRDIYEDEAGNLYVLQWNGGILWKNKNESVFTALDFPEDIHPVEMVEDGDNHCFWLQTWGQGIFNMSIDGNKCQLTKQPASLNPGGNKGLSLLYDKINHMLWTTTQDNIYAYRIIDGGLESFDLNQLLSPDNKIVNQLIQIQNGSIFVSGYMPHTFVILPYQEHIRRLPVDQMKTATGYPVLPDRSVCDNGLIWIWQGRIGLSLYNPDTESLQLAHWKPSRCITRNQSDNSGIWAAEKAELYKVEQDNGLVTTDTIRVVVNEATGIEEIVNNQQSTDSETIYDLQGRKVNNINMPGIYIINGKKYVIK